MTRYDAPEDLCDTCRNQPARYLAHRFAVEDPARQCDVGDTWQVCAGCKAQGERFHWAERGDGHGVEQRRIRGIAYFSLSGAEVGE